MTLGARVSKIYTRGVKTVHEHLPRPERSPFLQTSLFSNHLHHLRGKATCSEVRLLAVEQLAA